MRTRESFRQKDRQTGVQRKGRIQYFTPEVFWDVKLSHSNSHVRENEARGRLQVWVATYRIINVSTHFYERIVADVEKEQFYGAIISLFIRFILLLF